jgi:membrane protease YdiL (CAAX protease family)
MTMATVPPLPTPMAPVTGRWPVLGRWLELLVLFAGLPLLIWGAPFHLPKLPLLLVAALGCLLLLRRDAGFERRRLWNPQPAWPMAGAFLVRGVAVGLVAALLVVWLTPQTLLAFPRQRPTLWLLVMCLYPLLSAWPQELIYRVFFYHRYAHILGSPRAVAAASSLAFALLHIIFDNPLAVALTLPASLLFCHTYERTRSLLAVTIEHALYGCLIFTVGLGRYFYTGR